jgi:hypothetical protein
MFRRGYKQKMKRARAVSTATRSDRLPFNSIFNFQSLVACIGVQWRLHPVLYLQYPITALQAELLVRAALGLKPHGCGHCISHHSSTNTCTIFPYHICTLSLHNYFALTIGLAPLDCQNMLEFYHSMHTLEMLVNSSPCPPQIECGPAIYLQPQVRLDQAGVQTRVQLILFQKRLQASHQVCLAGPAPSIAL